MLALFFPGGRETGTRTFLSSRSHSSELAGREVGVGAVLRRREHPDDLVGVGQAALAEPHDLLLVLRERPERLAARRGDGDDDAGAPRLGDGEDDLLRGRPAPRRRERAPGWRPSRGRAPRPPARRGGRRRGSRFAPYGNGGQT